MLAGYTIRVTKPGNGGASMQEFFRVAIETGRISANVSNDAPLEVLGELSATEIGWLQLHQEKSVRSGEPSQDRSARAGREDDKTSKASRKASGAP